MQIVCCITLINYSRLSVSYFRKGRFEQVQSRHIRYKSVPDKTSAQVWQNCKPIGGKISVKTSIGGPENLNLLCPALKKGQPLPPIPDLNGDVVYVFIWGSN